MTHNRANKGCWITIDASSHNVSKVYSSVGVRTQWITLKTVRRQKSLCFQRIIFFPYFHSVVLHNNGYDSKTQSYLYANTLLSKILKYLFLFLKQDPLLKPLKHTKFGTSLKNRYKSSSYVWFRCVFTSGKSSVWYKWTCCLGRARRMQREDHILAEYYLHYSYIRQDQSSHRLLIRALAD